MLNGAFVRDLSSGGGGSALLFAVRTVQACENTKEVVLLMCDAGVTKLKTCAAVVSCLRFGSANPPSGP
jgi:hypothetical protein